MRVYDSPKLSKQAASKTALVHHCYHCKCFQIQTLGKYTADGTSIKAGPATSSAGLRCTSCDGPTLVGGPFYAAPMHQPEFLARMLDHIAHKHTYGTWDRMAGMLAVISEELPDLFSHCMAKWCHTLRITSPTRAHFVSALLNSGYSCSGTHTKATSIKTNAPANVIWKVVLAYCVSIGKELPATAEPLRLSAEKGDVDFTPSKLAVPGSVSSKMVRFQCNPQPYWGPQSRPARQNEHQDKKQRSE